MSFTDKSQDQNTWPVGAALIVEDSHQQYDPDGKSMLIPTLGPPIAKPYHHELADAGYQQSATGDSGYQSGAFPASELSTVPHQFPENDFEDTYLSDAADQSIHPSSGLFNNFGVTMTEDNVWGCQQHYSAFNDTSHRGPKPAICSTIPTFPSAGTVQDIRTVPSVIPDNFYDTINSSTLDETMHRDGCNDRTKGFDPFQDGIRQVRNVQHAHAFGYAQPMTPSNQASSLSDPAYQLFNQQSQYGQTVDFTSGVLSNDAATLSTYNDINNTSGQADYSFGDQQQPLPQQVPALPQRAGSGYHTFSNSDLNVGGPAQNVRAKCIPNERDPFCLRKVPARPYACTSRCGETFNNKQSWNRHEKINRPQEVWLCTLGACSDHAIYRKDHFGGHVRRIHEDQIYTKEMCEAAYKKISGNFEASCFFGTCERRFLNWKMRCNHIAMEHLEQPWDVFEWREGRFFETGRPGERTKGTGSSISSEDDTGDHESSHDLRSDDDTTQDPDHQPEIDRDQELHDRHETEYHGTAPTNGGSRYGNAATAQFSIYTLEQLRLAIFGLDGGPAYERQAELLMPDRGPSTCLGQSSTITSDVCSSGIFSAASMASSHSLRSSTSSVSDSKVQLQFVAVPSDIVDAASGSTPEPEIKVALIRYLREYDHSEAFKVGIRSSRPEYNFTTVSHPDMVRLRTTQLDRGKFEAYTLLYHHRHCMLFAMDLEKELVDDRRSGLVPQVKTFTQRSKAPTTTRERIRAYQPTSHTLFLNDIAFEHPPCTSREQSPRSESLLTRATSLRSDETSQNSVKDRGSVMLQHFLDQHPSEEPFGWFLGGVGLEEKITTAMQGLSLQE